MKRRQSQRPLHQVHVDAAGAIHLRHVEAGESGERPHQQRNHPRNVAVADRHGVRGMAERSALQRNNVSHLRRVVCLLGNRVYCTLKVHGSHRSPLGIHETALHQIHVRTVRSIPQHVVHLLLLLALLVRVSLESQMDGSHYASASSSTVTAIGRVDQVASMLEHHRQQVIVDLHSRNHHVLDLSEVELAREDEVVLRVTPSHPPTALSWLRSCEIRLKHFFM